MITDTLVRTKEIKDPLFSCIKAYCAKQMVEIKKEGDNERIAIAEQRYTNLMPKEVFIEKPRDFSPESIRACFLSRGRGFFHADAVIEKSKFLTIMKDFEIPVPKITQEALITEIEDKRISKGLFIYPNGKYTMVMNSKENTVEDAYKILGEIEWDKMTLTIDPAMDPATKIGGRCMLESIAIQNDSVPILYADYIIAAKAKK